VKLIRSKESRASKLCGGQKVAYNERERPAHFK
jgi:hypothetical protein